MELSDLRNQIEQIDKEILTAIAKRFEVAKEIAKIKKDQKLYDPAREQELLEAWLKTTDLEANFVRALFHLILNESRNIMIRNS